MKPLTDRVKATAVDYNTENMGAERVLGETHDGVWSSRIFLSFLL